MSNDRRLAQNARPFWAMVWLAGVTIVALGEPRRVPCGVSVQPRVAFAPADVRVIVTVEPAPENRFVEVSLADDLGTARASGWTVEGDRAARTTTIWWRGLGAGDWQVRVDVQRAGGGACRAATALLVN